MEDTIVPVALFAAIFGIVYLVASARHKEKMSMIEKGADPSLFHSKSNSGRYNTFKYGLFLVGIALGIFAGSLLKETSLMDELAAYFSMILLFGGIALVIAYLLRRKLEKEG